jgi:uncharacterized protein
MKSIVRWQKATLENRLKVRRVVIISGARQSGKTTLAEQVVGKDFIYHTLDDVLTLKTAMDDPHGFVDHKRGTMIIDEIQRAPILLLAIKKAVDQNKRPGEFLITGSAKISTLPHVAESLAGRVSYIRLRPFAQGEIAQKKPTFIKHAFSESLRGIKSSLKKQDIIEIALKGGYPETIAMNHISRKLWHKDYIQTLIDHDLKDISNINEPGALKQLVTVLAAWSGKFIDATAISSSMELTRQTITRYIATLEAMFIVEKVPYWWQTDYERAGKHAKFFMNDSGLMASLLDWNPQNIALDSDKVGKLVETFVFTQLAALIEAQEDDYRLFHYRDRQKREIDFLIEGPGGSLVGIEVKSGSMVSKDDTKHMRWFKENIAKKRSFIGIVLYTGEHALPLGENFWAVPMQALWG